MAWVGSGTFGRAERAAESDSPLPTRSATPLMMGAAIRELTALGVSNGVCGVKASLICAGRLLRLALADHLAVDHRGSVGGGAAGHGQGGGDDHRGERASQGPKCLH